jgi:chromosome segregation ATPase
MNKTRRAALSKLANDCDTLITHIDDSEDSAKADEGFWPDVAGQVEDLKNQAEDLKSEEEEYYENMPQSFQDGEKGENAQGAIDEMNTAIEALEEIDTSDEEGRDNVTERLESARDGLNNAAGY